MRSKRSGRRLACLDPSREVQAPSPLTLRSGSDNNLIHINICRLLDRERNGASDRIWRDRHVAREGVFVEALTSVFDDERLGGALQENLPPMGVSTAINRYLRDKNRSQGT